MLYDTLILGLALGFVQSHAMVVPRANIPVTVDLGYSSYTGTANSNGVTQWLGIRYAQNPVGPLRFQAPRAPLTDGITYKADAFAPICHLNPSASTQSEDCLFLNVFAPTANITTLRPVAVNIQGGAWDDLANPNLDGNNFIVAGGTDIVVVSLNYRVGPWGFLASSEVLAGGHVNAGLLDQRFALQWVAEYIHLFGGDPNHVTIFGVSSGGQGVDLQLTAYGGRDDGLFHGAISQSASFGAMLTVAESQYQYNNLSAAVGCSTAANTFTCLQNIDVATIVAHNPDYPTPGGAGGAPKTMWAPVVDGNLVQDNTYTLLSKGAYIKVPIITGDVSNEGTIFTPKTLATATDMNNFLKNNYVPLTAAQLSTIDSMYPEGAQYSGYSAYFTAGAQAYGDLRYTCPGLYKTTAYAYLGNNVWNYHYDILQPANAGARGVTHGADFGVMWGTSTFAPDNASIPIMQAFWTSFVRSYNPNTYKLSSAPTWDQFTNSAVTRFHFATDPTTDGMESVPASQASTCQFWNSIGAGLSQ